jgi:hypothetical protein
MSILTPPVASIQVEDAKLLEQVDLILSREIPPFARELVYCAREQRQTMLREVLAGRVEPRKPSDLMEARRLNQRLVALINNLDKWPAPVTIRVPQAERPVEITGELADPLWAKANVYPLFHRCNWPDKVGITHGSTRALWDENYLYLAYEFIKHGVFAPVLPRNGEVYEHDCAEFFFRPDPQQYRYYEINASPSGCVYDSALDKNPDRWYGKCNTGFDVQDLKLGWRVWDSTHRADGLTRYVVEMGIPWAEVLPSHVQARAGTQMQALFAGSVEFDSNKDFTHGYYCHSPIMAHFHNPDGFAPMILE